MKFEKRGTMDPMNIHCLRSRISKPRKRQTNINGYVFVPGKEDILCGRCMVRYDGSLNEYTIGSRETNSSESSPQWKSTVYSYENIRRATNAASGEVYLERKKKSLNSSVSWRFDFSTTGLVVDYLYMKINAEEAGGGQVTISLSGDAGYKWVPYFCTGSYVTIKGLSGSKTIRITANLMGDHQRQITRLLNQKLQEDYVSHALDIQIRLKRPDFMVGRSLLFLGLLFTTKESSRPVVPTKRKNEEEISSDKKNEVMLSIHIFKAKRLPCRKNGFYPRPKVKCTLLSGSNVCKMKTKHQSKTLNPCWNEYLNIPHPNSDVLKNSSLVINVTNSKVFISRTSEVLGHVCLQENSDLKSSRQGDITRCPRKRFCSSQSEDTLTSREFINQQAANHLKHRSVNISDIDSEDEGDDQSDSSNCNKDDDSANKTIPEIRVEEDLTARGLQRKNEQAQETIVNNRNSMDYPGPSSNDNCKNGTITSFRSINLDSRQYNRSFSFTSDGYNTVQNKPTLPLDKGDGSKTFYTLNSRKYSINSQTQSMDKKFISQYRRDKSRTLSFENENDVSDFYQHIKDNTQRNGMARSENYLGPFYDYSDKDFNSKCYINIDNENIDQIMSNDINASLRTLTQCPMVVVNSIKNYNDFYKRTNIDDTTLTRQKGKRVTRSRSFSTSELDRRQLKLKLSKFNFMKNKPEKLLSTKTYKSGSISNVLDENFEEKASELSHKHWTEAFMNPGRWYYCWHPLLGVDNLLNC